VGRADAAAGGVALLLGAATYAYTLTFPPMPEGHPGPALFPRLVAALLVLFGALLVWQARRPAPVPGPEGGAAEGDAGSAGMPRPGRRGWLDFVLVVGGVVFYIVGVERVGFPITIGVVNLVLMRRLGAGRVASIVAAALLGIGIYLVFARLLLVPLPLGLLGR
jgi:putative tricarboxylic transport membrane protein